MRYILNNGYIYDVSFGADIYCDLGDCMQYTGEIPSGYESLEQWHDTEIERLNAWKIVEGNLVYDENKAIEIQTLAEQQALENKHVTNKELEEKLSNVTLSEEQINLLISNAEEVANILPARTKQGKIIQIDDASNNPLKAIKITTENDITGTIKLLITGKNILKNTATSTTNNGIQYTVNSDKSIILNGTADGYSEFEIAGTSTNIVPLFVVKKDTQYYINKLPDGLTLNLYSYDEGLLQVYSGNGGEVLTLDEDFNITYITISSVGTEGYELITENEEQLTTEAGDILITEGEGASTFDNTIYYPMLSVGSIEAEYEVYKEKITLIPLENNALTNADTLNINENGEVELVKTTGKIQLDTITMPNTYDTYNVINTIQDTTLEISYKKSGFDYVIEEGSGILVLNNTPNGYGAVKKLVIEGLIGGTAYTLISSDNGENLEEYTIDLSKYTGEKQVTIESGIVYVDEEEIGRIGIKTYSPTTYISIKERICDFVCEYMLESDFSIFCTREEKDASIKIVEDQIAMEVSRATAIEGELSSSIKLEANKISQIVSSVGANGKVTAASIVSAINDGSSSIKIEADHIDIEGTKFPTITNTAGTSFVSTTEVFEEGKEGILSFSDYNVLSAGTQIRIGGGSYWTDPHIIINTSYGDNIIFYKPTDFYEDVRIIGAKLTVNGVEIDGTAKFG